MSPQAFKPKTVYEADGSFKHTLLVAPRADRAAITPEIHADVEATKRMLYDYFYEPNQQLYKLLQDIGVENFPRWED